MIINTLIVIFGIILAIGNAMTFIVWLKYQHQLLRTLLYFWLSGLLSYFAQAIFHNMDHFEILAFGVNACTVNILLRLYLDSLNIKKSLKNYNFLLAGSLGMSLISFQLTGDYKMSSLFFCIGCCFTLIHGASSLTKGIKTDSFTKGYQLLLVFAGLHFLDYPFFRTSLLYSVIGFSLSILFYFLFAIFVPIFILQKMSQSYTKDLEAQVQHRTDQLNNSYQQLNHAFNIMKTDKHHIKSILSDIQLRMSAIVHDLSTPIQVISHNFKIISEDKTAFANASRFDRVLNSLNSVKSILNDAKRAHSELIGQSDLKLETVDILDIFNEILRNYEENILNKKLNVNLEFPKDKKIQILANEDWIKIHVLSNLISNAIKFTKVGGEISIKAMFQGYDRIKIHIEDNGVGIDPQRAESLFNLSDKKSTVGTLGELGTGLGLPIVKQYTELMGGSVSLLKRSKAGSCFELEFWKSQAS